jgi:hypothetical protein
VPGPSVGTNPIFRWNPTDTRFPGHVTDVTWRAPRARASSKNRSYKARPRPAPRWLGLVAMRWTYAWSGWSGLMNPTRKPAGRPAASSASQDVPEKCWTTAREQRVLTSAPQSHHADERRMVRVGRTSELEVARDARRHGVWR